MKVLVLMELDHELEVPLGAVVDPVGKEAILTTYAGDKYLNTRGIIEAYLKGDLEDVKADLCNG